MTTTDLFRVLGVKPQLCGKGWEFYREAILDLEEEAKEVLSDYVQLEAEMSDDWLDPLSEDAERYWHGRLLRLAGQVTEYLRQLAWDLTWRDNIGEDQGQIRPELDLGRCDLLYLLDITGLNPNARLIAGVDEPDGAGEDDNLFDVPVLQWSEVLSMN